VSRLNMFVIFRRNRSSGLQAGRTWESQNFHRSLSVQAGRRCKLLLLSGAHRLGESGAGNPTATWNLVARDRPPAATQPLAEDATDSGYLLLVREQEGAVEGQARRKPNPTELQSPRRVLEVNHSPTPKELLRLRSLGWLGIK